MGKDRLEDFIKDSVYHHKTDVDSGLIWASIDAKKKRRRRLPLLWIFGLGMVIVLLGYVEMKHIDDRINQVSSNQNIENEVAIKNQPNEEVSKKLITATKDDILNDSKVISERPALVSKGETINRSNLKSKYSKNEVETKKDKFVSALRVEYNSNSADKETSSNRALPEKINSLQNDQVSIFPSQLRNPISFPLLLNPLKFLMDERSKLDLNLQPSIEGTSSISNRWKTKFGISTRLMTGKRTLQCMDSTSQSLAKRNTNEEFMEAWGVGLNFEIENSYGLVFNTGVVYQQINDRSILQKTEEMFLNEKPYAYSIYTKEIQVFDQHRYNKIRMIDIPLLIGYNHRMNKWGLSAAGGININVRTSASGNVIGETGFINVKEVEMFRNRVGYNWQFHGGLDYYTDNLKISLHPLLQYYPSSFTEDHICIDQKYTLWGLNLGLTSSF